MMHYQLEKLYLARYDLPIIYSMDCDDWVESSILKRCAFGSESPRHEAVLIGDSMAGQWFSVFSQIALWPDWRFTVFTKSSCPMVDQPYFYVRIGREFRRCEIWRDKLLTEITTMKPDLILMGSSPNYPFSQIQWTEGTSGVLKRISSYADRIVILRSTPVLPYDALTCARNQAWQQKQLWYLRASDCSVSIDNTVEEDVYQALKLASRPYNNVEVVNLNSIVCPGGVCSATRDDKIIFRDRQHLTDKFVQSITSDVLKVTGLDNVKTL